MKLFRNILPDTFSNISQRFEHDVERIILATLIGVSLNRLTDTEKSTIEKYVCEGQPDAIVSFLKRKYTKTEWESLLNKEIKPLIEDYIEEILIPK